MNDPIDDYIVHFLSRRESEEDIEKLKEWLDSDASNKKLLQEWLQVWDAADMAENFDKYNTQRAYNNFLTYLKDQEKKTKQGKEKPKPAFVRRLHSLGRIAAVFILSFSLGAGSIYYYMKNYRQDSIAYVENIIPLGSKSEIILPDGSTVWVNAGSKLRYPTDYGKTSRDIYLEGEGYFKVAKDEKKAFTVHTSVMSVRALGTEFNVKAYPEEDIVETTLISGEVAIEGGSVATSTRKAVLLKPGQKYSISSEREKKPSPQAQLESAPLAKTVKPQIKQLSPDIANAEVSWKGKNWRIEKEKLRSLSVKLERRYDVRIHVDEKLLDYHFTSTLKDESLEQVLRAMQSSAPILYTVEGKNVTITADLKRMR